MKQSLNTKEILGFNDRWWMIIGIPTLSFFIPILFFEASLSNGLLLYLPEWIISAVYTSLYWLSCRSIFIHFRRKYPHYYQTQKRILSTATAEVVAYALITVVCKSIMNACGMETMEQERDVSTLDYIVPTAMLVIIASALYESGFLYSRWKRSIQEAERLRREQVESQLEGLKSQVNPHFLFNSLNTLAYLIPEDPGRSVQFVEQLSKVYRHILEMGERQLVPLREELVFLEAYIFLLEARFGDRLQLKMDIPEEWEEAQVIPLALQILVENAIKHNIISQDHPLAVNIYVEDGQLIVRNALQPKQQKMPSTGMGLQNIRNRYAYFTHAHIRVQETNNEFVVALPLLMQPAPVR